MTDKQRSIVANALLMSGLFVTAGNESTNVMTTHWGGLVKMWNREVFMLPVRKKRYTHELIEKNKCFVVNVPRENMANIISACDHLSGKGINKFEKLGITPVSAKSLPTVAIEECSLIFECKVIYATDMEKAKLDGIIARDMYINKEFHTLFFGEIINCYVQRKKSND